jgi:hypothetical protein
MDWLAWAKAVNLTLSLLGKLGAAGRAMKPRLSPYLGRLLLTVEGQPVKMFRGERPPYEMIQVWVSNGWVRDAQDVRCDIRWRRHGIQMQIRGDTVGAWCPAVASDMQTFASLPLETITLPSNGGREHLGLLIKYPGERDAYIVTRSNYLSASPRWKNQAFALAPGGYDVDLMFTAAGQKGGTVTLSVWNDGANGTIRCDLAPRSTVG